MCCNRGSLAAEEIVLQYSLVGSRFVLQYKLYCEPEVGLCRDTTRDRQLGAAWAQGAQPGHAGWPRAVHLVHPACFWPDLTQYCS